MAQGPPKKLSKKPACKPKGALKKGAKVIKPKSKKAARTITSDKIKKKLAAGVLAKTEARLGQRAGHLELIGKGKKSSKEEKEKYRGGTRKFG